MDNNPTVEAQMLIRKPINIVFNAFIDPSITTNFWFTHASSMLLPNARLEWKWEMYDVTTEVHVIQIIQDQLIKIEWGKERTTVEILFEPISETSTYVVIKNYGFTLENEELIQALMDYTGGFTTVLDGMKAYLEYGIKLNLIADKFPQ